MNAADPPSMAALQKARERGREELPQTIENITWEEMPGFASLEELTAYLGELMQQPLDYNSCCSMMHAATVATFRTISHHVGASGAQAELTSLAVLGSIRGEDGPFAIVAARDLVYSDDALQVKVAGYEEKWAGWLAEKARENLAGGHEHVHPAILARWRELAEESA